MKIRTRVPLAIIFLGSVFAVGIPYWSIPLQALALPRDLWGPGLAVSVALGAGGPAFAPVRPWAAGACVAGAVVAAVMARIAIDVFGDATRHNLWPFEIVLALGPGLLAGLAAALAGTLVVRMRRD